MAGESSNADVIIPAPVTIREEVNPEMVEEPYIPVEATRRVRQSPTVTRLRSILLRVLSCAMERLVYVAVGVLAVIVFAHSMLPGGEPLLVNEEFERLLEGAMDGPKKKAMQLRKQPSSAMLEVPKCSDDPRIEMTTIDMIKANGYPAEEHFLQTADNYVLALHRIPKEGAPTVLLQHALLESSFCWVVNGKHKSLAFILSDAGYDVWMGNSRGNTYSRNHTGISPNLELFWNFSWHDMGVFDLSATIDYINGMTHIKPIFIGHSMGTTMFYVMASERPHHVSRVKAMFGLAPVAFTDHITGPFWLLGSILGNLQKGGRIDGHFEFFNQNSMFKFAGKCICNRPLMRHICEAFIFSTVGFNANQFDTSMLPVILSHTPAGTSFKTILHYAQGIRSQKFRQYDYGEEENMEMYNSAEPPEYDVSRIKIPMTLFWGANDYLAHPKDVRRLGNMLRMRKLKVLKVDDPHFNHLDFLWGIDTPKLVYKELLEAMEEYRDANKTYNF